jgi:hypothetical protein
MSTMEYGIRREHDSLDTQRYIEHLFACCDLPRYCNSVNISFWVNVLCTNHFIENREDEAFSYHDRSTTLNSEEGARGSSAPRC